MAEKEESLEFRERKELTRLQLEADKEKTNLQIQAENLRFKNRMELLRYERESSHLFHENELERGRIKRAEERKLMAEKDHYFRNRGRP